MHRRLRIVGKKFDAAVLKQAIESIDSSNHPNNEALELLVDLCPEEWYASEKN